MNFILFRNIINESRPILYIMIFFFMFLFFSIFMFLDTYYPKYKRASIERRYKAKRFIKKHLKRFTLDQKNIIKNFECNSFNYLPTPIYITDKFFINKSSLINYSDILWIYPQRKIAQYDHFSKKYEEIFFLIIHLKNRKRIKIKFLNQDTINFALTEFAHYCFWCYIGFDEDLELQIKNKFDDVLLLQEKLIRENKKLYQYLNVFGVRYKHSNIFYL